MQDNFKYFKCNQKLLKINKLSMANGGRLLEIVRPAQSHFALAICRGSRASRRRPRGRFFVRWSPKGERQTEIGRLGVQPNQYAVVGGSQPPAWRAYGAYLRVQNSVLSVRST